MHDFWMLILGYLLIKNIKLKIICYLKFLFFFLFSSLFFLPRQRIQFETEFSRFRLNCLDSWKGCFSLFWSTEM